MNEKVRIVFNYKYHKELRKKIKTIVDLLPFQDNDKSLIESKAIELFNFTLKNGMKPQNLDIKNSGVLSIVYIYFALLFYDYLRIDGNPLTYGFICRLLGNVLQLVGLNNCKSYNIGKISLFLPTDLRKEYRDFIEKGLHLGKMPFEEFKEFIENLGLEKTGIEGRILSPKNNYEILEPQEYKEMSPEKYYELIKGKKGTEIQIPVWCGKKEHKLWNAILSNLLQSKWCKKCEDESRIKYSHKYLKKLAKRRGIEDTGVPGKVLNFKDSNEELTINTYKENTKKVNPGKAKFWWSCGIKCHPSWKTTPSKIEIDNTWCPVCKGGHYIYEELIKLAKESGTEETGVAGRILDSKESRKQLLKTTYNKLTKNKKPSEVSFWWSCEREHPPFKNSPPNIRRGQWCPICSQKEGKYERIIREYFQKIFGLSFPETYLRDLSLKTTKIRIKLNLLKIGNKLRFEGYEAIYPQSYSLEDYEGSLRFDGYAEIIKNGRLFKIAFEFNGIQHYEFPNYWFNKPSEGKKLWLEYITRDQLKKEISKLNNILFIEFPYYVDRTLEHPKKIQEFIINQFELKPDIGLNI
ncbi:hypothetical protein ES706_06656 [subsurface metagenome]